MAELKHRFVETNGIKMHIAEQGTGPLVLLLHGFPEIWYSWRLQIPVLANAGFHVVAPDLRGYGQTDAPVGVENYTHLDIVGDLVGLLDALNEQQAFVVGHDWGANIAWSFAMIRPDRVKALVAISVPFTPHRPYLSPVKRFEKLLGEGFYYCRFQEPGRAEADFARFTIKDVLKTLLASNTGLMLAPKEKELFDVMKPPKALPPWITEEDIAYYASQYKKSGFTPPLNYYRATDLSWRLMGAWSGKGVDVPTIFIAGEKDIVYNFPGAKEFIHSGGLKKHVPNLKEVIIIPQAYHFVQQQKADEVNEHLIKFFRSSNLAKL